MKDNKVLACLSHIFNQCKEQKRNIFVLKFSLCSNSTTVIPCMMFPRGDMKYIGHFISSGFWQDEGNVVEHYMHYSLT